MNPFAGYALTSPFGYRIHPVDQVKKFHRGVDLVTSAPDRMIYAFVAGEVVHAKESIRGSGLGGYGIVVAIKDDRGYLHCYAHLSAVLVKVGEKLKRGQKLGLQGSSGLSTAEHLHYEIRKWYTPSFGYTESENGVVEPTKYLQDYYAKEELSLMEKADANTIIELYLKPAWGAAKTAIEKKEIGRLADVLRVASGQSKQNV
ncbi:M23 family metallopeptidase [Paenibacillus pini]|uniref:Peptidase M23B n=1 Tax=Paenibacillus pini JCM 16418 TaxID=1236976 RepID=W7YJ10_9BACL|nr:M23 family metallopeptidase [Paenibacillus pini]GAF07563.1 peptidase M23B [Paenibacillus pini JCM 16418]